MDNNPKIFVQNPGNPKIICIACNCSIPIRMMGKHSTSKKTCKTSKNIFIY